MTWILYDGSIKLELALSSFCTRIRVVACSGLDETVFDPALVTTQG